ncbi:hypothetical protein BaRGS_00019680 [Batillaria attramentaria]|uniref:Uncharacterized protein n=1 Tax=Batillaria attramentaria TaxID=370345 RepID=A0ABD0KPI7_9CAEN
MASSERTEIMRHTEKIRHCVVISLSLVVTGIYCIFAMNDRSDLMSALVVGILGKHRRLMFHTLLTFFCNDLKGCGRGSIHRLRPSTQNLVFTLGTWLTRYGLLDMGKARSVTKDK